MEGKKKLLKIFLIFPRRQIKDTICRHSLTTWKQVETGIRQKVKLKK